MKPFLYDKPADQQSALSRKNTTSQFIAGGTNLLDLMKKHIAEPDMLVDVQASLSADIIKTARGIQLGAMSRNAAVAMDPRILSDYPLVAKAILAGASPQIRNMASTAGNMLQRTRCPYFYDITLPCNKRKPGTGTGCSALHGDNRMSAIIGWSENCVAVHPSDFCISLAALDANVIATGKDGKNITIPFKDFHRLPGDNPQVDNNLPANAIIQAVEIPANPFHKNYAYVKLRDRDSYAFALVSVAAAVQLTGKTIRDARLASGGVAHKPWRWYAAEAFLKGKTANEATFKQAAAIIAAETKPLEGNGFKVSMLRGAVEVALQIVYRLKLIEMGFFDEHTDSWPPEDGRVEAVAKVTGGGKYSAEYRVDNCCYGVLVESTIPAGTITRFNLDDAKQASGVIDILTHLNKPAVPGFADEAKIKESRFGLPIFYTDKVYFKGQPIALVIAETFEEATYAASLVTAEYNKTSFNVDFNTSRKNATLKEAGKTRGDIAGALATQVIDQEYTIQSEVHNPMEMHATIAQWTATDKLMLYDKTQGVNNVQKTISKLFAIPNDNVHVISEFVGGGFGAGLRVWPHTLAAAMAARQVNRPVKVVLTRPQMFSMVGYRPESWQRIRLGADATGKFTYLQHQAMHVASLYDSFSEGITRISRMVYKLDNLKTESAMVPLNLSNPTWMRGPGDCTGDFAVESAVDEMSYALKMDPIDLRLKNLALDKDPESGKPWSTHFLDECLAEGAKKINWKKRNPLPAQQEDGDWQIGYGMAVGMWTAGRQNASASAELRMDGTLTIKTAMTDIGTGTGTSMQNMAHTATGIPKEMIRIELGNSDLPPAPSQGGSTGLSTISGAVSAAISALKLKLAAQAAGNRVVYKTATADDIVINAKGIAFKKEDDQFVSFQEIFSKNNLTTIEAEASSGPGAERQKYAFCSSAAHFCLVRVHRKTGKVKIDKIVAVVDGGTIVSRKPAANQVSGAAIGGIGMALMEEQKIDVRLGSLIANDLAGYHFAVNADAPIIDVSFINKPDPNINPSGAKGLGEVGIIGAAAAIANAIYHATGKRQRDLPITPDKILNSLGK